MPDFRYALAIDSGGTFIKSAIINNEGQIFSDWMQQIPVNSEGSIGTILAAFKCTINSAFDLAERNGFFLYGVGIGIPGPFDYPNATSLMPHKFQALYGLNFAQALREEIPCLKEKTLVFAHDVHAFLMGEAWCGAGKGYSRIVGITLGTGIGIGFMADGTIVDDGLGGPFKSIFKLPVNGAILEDFVSKRGIIKSYQQRIGVNVSVDLDVKDIAELAVSGDIVAIDVFSKMGHILGTSLKRILIEFRPECLVLGGQISNAFDLFSKNLGVELRDVPTLQSITKAKHLDTSALCGAAKLIFS